MRPPSVAPCPARSSSPRPAPRILAPLLAVLVSAGCTAGVATEISEPIRPVAPLELEALAILPVTADLGSGNAAPPVEEAVVEVHLKLYVISVQTH